MNHITSFQLFNEGLFGFGKPDEESIKQAIGFLFIKPPKEDEFFYKELPDVGTMKPFHTDPSVKKTTLMGLAKLLNKKSLNQAESYIIFFCARLFLERDVINVAFHEFASESVREHDKGMTKPIASKMALLWGYLQISS